MRRVFLIIQNPSERQLWTDILKLANITVVASCGTMIEARDKYWDTMSNGVDHVMVDGTEAPSPLLGFAAEPERTIDGWFGPVRVFGRKQAGDGRSPVARIG